MGDHPVSGNAPFTAAENRRRVRFQRIPPRAQYAESYGRAGILIPSAFPFRRLSIISRISFLSAMPQHCGMLVFTNSVSRTSRTLARPRIKGPEQHSAFSSACLFFLLSLESVPACPSLWVQNSIGHCCQNPSRGSIYHHPVLRRMTDRFHIKIGAIDVATELQSSRRAYFDR